MKKLKRVMTMLLSVIMVMAVLTGCGGRPKIDPIKTVQAIMDAALKGEVSEYAKISGESEEDLKAEYEELLDMLADGMKAELNMFGAADLDTKPLAEEMINSVKYEVKDAAEDKEGNYTVNVLVYPSDFMELALQETIKNAIAAENVNQIGDIVMQAFDTALDQQTFGEPETYQVRILYNEEEKNYEVSDEDMQVIGETFFAIPEELTVATGKDYGNVYLNWLKEDWNAATDEEKTNCCLKILQKVGGFSDEQMSWIDMSEPMIQQSVQQMKDGIQMVYDNGVNMSVGDFTEYMMSMGMM